MDLRGRAGSASFADIYGSAFGAKTATQGNPAPVIGSSIAQSQAAVAPQAPDRAIAHAFLTTPAGVLVIIAGALIVFSLTD